MAIALGGSVGRNGANARDDVIAVQGALNAFAARLGIAPLAVNGVADSRTLEAIEAFQRRVLDQASPDGRIDPRGRTVRALEGGSGSETAAAAPLGMVRYHDDIPETLRLASGYAIRVIERALTTAELNAAMITSTMRLPAEQADIMYRMAQQDLAKQLQLYGATGDQVLQVFKTHRAKPRHEVVELMRLKIEELGAKGMRVSSHVVTPGQYAKLNVIDLGVNSTRRVAGASFTDRSKAALTRAFKSLETQGFIRKFIDETAKSNNCWHIEVVPDAKRLA